MNNNQEKENFAELQDYLECQPSELEVGEKFKYTQQIFQKRERCVKIGVVFEFDEDDGQIIAIPNGTNHDFDPYKLDINHKYKFLRFYKKNKNSNYQEIDNNTTTDELEQLEKQYECKFEILTPEKLTEDMIIYYSNNKWKKTTREMKKGYYQYTKGDIISVKSTQESVRNTNINTKCRHKKYLMYLKSDNIEQ